MKKILVDLISDYIRCALLEDGELKELIIDNKNKPLMAGNIYVGRVKKLLKGEFAFIDLGDSRDSFLQMTCEDKKVCKVGSEIIVRVVKEATEQKGATVSTELNFNGRYCVLIVNNQGTEVGVSQKITDSEKREALKKLALNAISGYERLGVVIRTEAQGAGYEEIVEELNSLIRQAMAVLEKGKFVKAPYELYSNENEIISLFRETNSQIIVNELTQAKKLFGDEFEYTLYEGDIPLFSEYFIETQIENALKKKVWLKGGGYIYIEETEAMTVIDVNSGKLDVKGYDKLVLKTNIQAADEIFRQIRLRNLSGIIIIDFVDLKNNEQKAKLIKHCRELAGLDRQRCTVVGLTELNLMQLTRRKRRNSLSRILCKKCSCCDGNGFVYNEDYLADKIKNEIISIFSSTIYDEILVSSSKKIIKAIQGQNKNGLLEKKYEKTISYNIIETQKANYYKLDKICRK